MISSNNILTDPLQASAPGKNFAKMYTASRQKENRIYSDEQVALLPFIEPSHIHYEEWQVRKRSGSRLMDWLEHKNKPLFIQEVGCGNGWLSGKLTSLKNSFITGTDINKTELFQARRVFGKKPNLEFAEGDIRTIASDATFDVIIFAAAIQYFPSFDQIIGAALSHLNPAGEIHILDSHFYQTDELEKAKQRSQLYYQSIGYDEMAKFYFHHSFDSLKAFHYKLLFNPLNFKNKLFARNDPFPWICISVL